MTAPTYKLIDIGGSPELQRRQMNVNFAFLEDLIGEGSAFPTDDLLVGALFVKSGVLYQWDGAAWSAVTASPVIVGAISTTNATATTIATLAIASNTTAMVVANVAARRTGGSSGATGDAGGFQLVATIKNIAGTLTIVNQTLTYTHADQGGWTVTAVISGTDIQFKVTGAANNNVDWTLAGSTVVVS